MNPSKYKTTETRRGFTYNYYFASAKQSKPTILFCHGFPSTSSHWRREALFFEERGYGVVVPDMLGYGGTSKPTETDDYLPSKVSKDIVEILDAENLEKVIAIGHDWGSSAVSRLATHYPERFLAYAFFAVPYIPVRPPVPYESLLAYSKAKYGYEIYGYWEYLASEEFEVHFRANPNAFVNILFPSDPNTWVTHMAPRGLLKKAIHENFSEHAAKYVTEEDKKETIETFLKNGMKAPTRWYDILITTKASQDNIATIPEDRRFPPATSPIFFGAAKHDKVCVPQQGYEIFSSKPFQNHSVTIREFEGDHWIILSCADEINKELLRWIEDVVVVKASL